jgi:hypothetical protein
MSLKQASLKLAAAGSDDILVRDELTADVLAKSQQVAIEADNAQMAVMLRLEEILMQIADNVYNIAGKIGAQMTSLQTVRDFMVMDRQLESRQDSQEELRAIEEDREEGREAVDPKTQEKMSYLEQFFKQLNGILRVFTALLIPIGIGAFLRLREWVSENFGEMARTLMDIGTVIGGFLLVFRKLVVSIFTKVSAVAGALFKSLDKVLPALKGALGLLGRIVSKIALPLTLLVGMWEAVTAAIEGYEKGGITGAIREGLAGLAGSLIGWIGDLAGWAFGNVVQMLGFEDLGQSIKDFDFTALVKDTVGQLYDFVSGYLTSWVSAVGDAFDQLLQGNAIGAILSIVSSPFKGLYDGLANALKVDPAAMMKESFLQLAPPGSLLDWVIPDAVYRSMGVDPETGDRLPPEPKVSMKEVAREMFIKYAPVRGYLDYLIPDRVYRSLGIDPETGGIIDDLPESITAEEADRIMRSAADQPLVDASRLEPVFVDPSSVRPGAGASEAYITRVIEQASRTSSAGQDPLVIKSNQFDDWMAVGNTTPASLVDPQNVVVAGSPTMTISNRMVAASEIAQASRNAPARQTMQAGSSVVNAPVVNSVNNQTALMGPLTAVGNQFGVGLF